MSIMVIRNNMTRFFTSDTHFSHRNVIPYCNRPYKDIEEMNSEMTRIWNETVKPEDEIIFLGDLDINPKRFHRDSLHTLNGIKKLLIVGNHDLGFEHIKTRGPSQKILAERQKLMDFGWEEVCQRKIITLNNGQAVLLNHLPFLEGNEEVDLRYKDLRPKYEGLVLIHGHQHARYIKSGQQIDVGFDGKLGLYSEDEIIELINDPRDNIESRITEFYKQSKPRVLEK